MTDNLNRIYALVSSVVTWAVALAAGLTAAAGAIAEVAPEGAEPVVGWLLRAATVLTVAWQAVRRVTPVAPDQRGLLPVAETYPDDWPQSTAR